MSDRALSITREYLRSPDSQVKKNAATALAAIASRDSIETLVRLALTDPDPKVRAHAEEEIGALEQNGIAQAQGILESFLLEDELSRESFALLGRLRLKRPLSPAEERPLPMRLRRAATLGRPAPGFWRSLRWQALFPSFYATLLAVALLYAYLLLVLRQVVTVYAPLFLVLPLALSATRGLSPFGLYYDRTAGLLVEVSKATYGALKICALFCLAFLAVALSDRPNLGALASILWVCGASALFAGAVRCGTLLAWGLFRSYFVNRYAQAIVGVAAGSLVLTLLLFAGHTWLPSEGHEAFDTAWIYFLPMGVGLAWVFAKIDAQAPGGEPALGRWPWALPAALLGAVAIPFVILLVPARKSRSLPDLVASPRVPYSSLEPKAVYDELMRALIEKL